MKAAMVDTVRMFFVVMGISIFMLAACGGGTTGTGGTGSSEFRGIVVATDGRPVVNATIILEENDTFAVTDLHGEWKLQTDYDPSAATFAIQTASLEVKTVLSNLPNGPKEVEVDFKVDTQKRSVKVTKKRVKRRPVTPIPTLESTETPEVTETPSESPTISETPSVTPSITVTGTITPGVTPSGTATATNTPTATPSPKSVN